jgi:hypothetical protein
MDELLCTWLSGRQQEFLDTAVTNSCLGVQQSPVSYLRSRKVEQMSHRTERRRRKKSRERIDLPPPPNPPLDVRDGRHGDIALFAEPQAILADMRLVKRAVRDGWDVPEKMRSWLPEAIIEAVTLPHAKSGVDEWTLDRNAIAGARAILAMTAENMRQEHAEGRRLLAEYKSTLR